MKLKGCVISNVGLKKYINEDNYLISNLINETSQNIKDESLEYNVKKNQLFYAAVLDGMGGGEGGQWASHATAEMFRNILRKESNTRLEYEVDGIVRRAFLEANRQIVEARKVRSVLGTTATLLCILDDKMKVYHLGDSRAYLYTKQKLVKLTKDQTLADLKIEAGLYSKDNPQVPVDQNLLTEYLGADETMSSIAPLESKWISVNEDDMILLCSDGFHRYCEEQVIKEVLASNKETEQMADRLVSKALKNGGIDNITCMVISVRD